MTRHQKHPAKTSDANQDDSTPLTIAELKAIAKTKLRKQVWDYYVSGADDQLSVRRNERAYSKLLIRPRIMRDVSSVDTSVTMFGKRYSFPVGVSPSAMQRLVGGEGELDMARAVAHRGTFLTLSSNATTALEDVIEAPGKPVDFWFQLYVSQDREKSAKLIRRAEAAGYKALAITADTPVLGNRINERKKQLVLPEGLSLVNLENSDPNAEEKPSLNRQLLQSASKEEAQCISDEAAEYGLLNDASLNWAETIPWLRKQTNMKIIIKGVMTSEDALLAVQHGADAIVVSNHGGRQLDGVPSTIEVLPEIAAAVRGRIPVIFDGGITRGSDVFKALALGADFTMIGRAPLWGLAYDGRKGVELVLNILERELTRTMALAGAKSIAEITSNMLAVTKHGSFGVAKL